MVVKVYISGMSGNKEVKKRQQRVTMILDSKLITYTAIDITEPGKEAEKDFMQTNSKHKGCTISDPSPRHPLPPQLFNDTEYCGDYDDFDLANEVDTLEVFLKLEAPKAAPAVDTSTAATDVAADEQQQKNGGDSDDVPATTGEDDENKENKTEEDANEDNEESREGNAELSDSAEDATVVDAVDVEGKSVQDVQDESGGADVLDTTETVEDGLQANEIPSDAEVAKQSTETLVEAMDANEVTDEAAHPDGELPSATTDISSSDIPLGNGSKQAEEIPDLRGTDEEAIAESREVPLNSVDEGEQASETTQDEEGETGEPEPMDAAETTHEATHLDDLQSATASVSVESKQAEEILDAHETEEKVGESVVEEEVTDSTSKVARAEDTPTADVEDATQPEVGKSEQMAELGEPMDAADAIDGATHPDDELPSAADASPSNVLVDHPADQPAEMVNTVPVAVSKSSEHEEPTDDADMADEEERELLQTSAALGKSEDAEEAAEALNAEEDAAQDDDDMAEEEAISGKLVDTDDPMLAAQEQEE